MAESGKSSEPEIARLRRRLERERLARREAEAIAERTTRQLYCDPGDGRAAGCSGSIIGSVIESKRVGGLD